MALIATDELPSPSPIFPEAWVLTMRTEDETVVRVYVAHDALLAFESVRYENKRPQLEGEHRLRIEKIASDKYGGGVTAQDGSVRITRDDVDC